MAVRTRSRIKELARFTGDGAPVTTCYLDLDGRVHPKSTDVEAELERLLRRARQRLNGHSNEHAYSDLNRIESFVKQRFDRGASRAVAIFTCTEPALFEVVPLPVRVRSRIVTGSGPALAPLESVVETHKRLAVLLVDRQRVRLLRFDFGELVDHTDRVEDLTRDIDSVGGRERGELDGHVDALLSQHARGAAAVAWAVHQEHGFDLLALGGPDETLREVEAALHPYLREKLCGRVAVKVGAGLDEIRAAALELEEAAERAHEAEVVDGLRASLGSGSKAVAGLAPTLAAVSQGRVSLLVVSEGYEAEGWRCTGCGCLCAVAGPNRTCKDCGADVVEVEDVVAEAVDVTLAHGGLVEVCVGNADLDVLGRIGALLRF